MVGHTVAPISPPFTAVKDFGKLRAIFDLIEPVAIRQIRGKCAAAIDAFPISRLIVVRATTLKR